MLIQPSSYSPSQDRVFRFYGPVYAVVSFGSLFQVYQIGDKVCLSLGHSGGGGRLFIYDMYSFNETVSRSYNVHEKYYDREGLQGSLGRFSKDYFYYFVNDGTDEGYDLIKYGPLDGTPSETNLANYSNPTDIHGIGLEQDYKTETDFYFVNRTDQDGDRTAGTVITFDIYHLDTTTDDITKIVSGDTYTYDEDYEFSRGIGVTDDYIYNVWSSGNYQRYDRDTYNRTNGSASKLTFIKSVAGEALASGNYNDVEDRAFENLETGDFYDTGEAQGTWNIASLTEDYSWVEETSGTNPHPIKLKRFNPSTGVKEDINTDVPNPNKNINPFSVIKGDSRDYSFLDPVARRFLGDGPHVVTDKMRNNGYIYCGPNYVELINTTLGWD